MYINITDPCSSYVNYVNQKEQVKLDKLGGGACLKTPDLQYTYSINQSKIKVCFFHCVLGAFSIGDRSQRI